MSISKEETEKTPVKPIDWRDIFERYFAYHRWIISSVLMALVFGLLYFRTQYDSFYMQSTLLITENSTNGQMSQMSILKQLDAMGMSSGPGANIYNERKVIQSKQLISRVADELNLYYTYSVRKWMKPVEIYTASPIQVQLSPDDLFRIEKKMKLEVEYDNEDGFVITGKHKRDRFKFKVQELPARVVTPVGELTIRLSNPDYLPEEKIYVTIDHPVRVIKRYQESLFSIDNDDNGDIIYIGLTEHHQEKAKDIINRLIDTYNTDAIDQINKSASFTALFIDARLALLTEELESVEKSIEAYMKDNKLTDISTDAMIYLQRNNLYDERRNEVDIQLQIIKYIEEFLIQPENRYALIPNLGITDTGLMLVINEYNKFLSDRERVAAGSSPNNPLLKTIEAQVKSSRDAIVKNIAISRSGLEISINELDQQNRFLLSQIKKIPQQQREFLEISRQQQIKEELYLFLLQKREEASLSMAITVPKGRLLDPADSARKVAPSLLKTILVALFFGLLLPFAFLYAKFFMEITFYGRKEVESLTRIPVIAELAHQSSNDTIIDHGTNASANAELLRLMRSKLQFVLNRPEQKVILVTSTVSGEGKTFVSINLSVSVSLAGKKVLLMGMDLRKPMLAHHFNIEDNLGITSYLSGEVEDFNELIHQSKEFKNLHIMPGGIIPPNPNELILNERLDRMMSALRERYDFILIDSAPVGAVSDTFLINRTSDMTLYVCRANYSDKRNLEYLNRVAKEQSLKNIYLVVNDVDLVRSHYGVKNTGSYGYGYGYGYGKKSKHKDSV